MEKDEFGKSVEELPERKIRIQKEIEEQNEANVENTMDFLAIHIDGNKVKEYFEFLKKIRKIKKKINKKKEQLKQKDALRDAYLMKESEIDTYFSSMNEDYRKIGFKNKKNTRGVLEVDSFGSPSMLISNIPIGVINCLINKAAENNKYIEQMKYDEYISNHKVYANSPEDYKALQEILQNHYNFVNGMTMIKILFFYENELEYWKNYLKKLEKSEENMMEHEFE